MPCQIAHARFVAYPLVHITCTGILRQARLLVCSEAVLLQAHLYKSVVPRTPAQPIRAHQLIIVSIFIVWTVNGQNSCNRRVSSESEDY